jgi:hypothetical protein
VPVAAGGSSTAHISAFSKGGATQGGGIAGSSPFTRRFRGPSCKALSVLLAALFALPMTVEQLAISYQKHTWRNAHEPSLVVGRRCRKSHDGFLRLRL